MSDQWSGINRADHPDLENIRRAEPDHPLDFFRGRDFHGRYLFLIKGNASREALPSLPKLAGIDVALVESEPTACRLLLTLLDNEQIEIFRALCANLLAATSTLSRGENGPGIVIVLNRLHRWQALLRKRTNGLLTRQQIIGLVGELLFLRDRLLSRMDPLDAANSWRGPGRDEQDFVIGRWIVEVKSQLSTADRCLQISSEHQLDTTSGPIMICHQILGLSNTGNASARTLNAIIDEITDHLSNRSVSATDVFRSGLIEAGYRNRSEYDDENWLFVCAGFYQVSDSFPRIIPSSLSEGIERVRYNVRFDACEPFSLPECEAMGIIFDDAADA